METETMTEALKGAESALNQLAVVGVKSIDDTDKDMTSEVLDDLQLDSRDDKDRLHKDDTYKYKGDEKFNPKSFKSGSSVGYIDLNKATEEVSFAQIRMLKELMFDVIRLSRYNHLVGNRGSKVWSKRTALMVVPWKNKMACPMTLPGNPDCYCPIKSWTSKEMFIAHWQIYHIDQHTSRIICEHSKEGILCHYMTDHEADMKTHINKLHESSLKEKLASNSYVPENAWLDLTSSWSIKDLGRSYKTFPESHYGTSYDVFIWVIIDTDAKDTRTKANIFRVLVYACQDWDQMINLGTQTFKEMLKSSAEKQESTPKVSAKQKKRRARKAQRHKSKATEESESSDSADEQTAKSAGGK